MKQVWISPATFSDMDWLFVCRNQPELYRHGFTPREVSWREHSEWFAECLDSPNSYRIFIIMLAKTQAGMVRLEKTPFDEAEISIYVLPSEQGSGIGSKAIEIASKWALNEWGALGVSAFVGHENAASLRAFEKAGYIKDGEWSDGPILTWGHVRE